MAKHPTSSRVHRDSKQGPDDAFVGAVEQTVAWVRKHQRPLAIGAVAAILLVAAALYYVNYQRTLENQATTRLAQLQGTIASGNTQLARRDLQEFVDRFGSTEAGRQARVVLAELHLSEGEPSEAIQALGNLARDLDTSGGVAAGRIKAAAHEALGETDEAVALYTDIADQARFDFERREALADAARVRLQNGDPEAAAALYQRIVQTFDEAEPGRGYYEMWLAEARARAESGVTPAAATPAPGVDGEAGDTAAGDTGS